MFFRVGAISFDLFDCNNSDVVQLAPFHVAEINMDQSVMRNKTLLAK